MKNQKIKIKGYVKRSFDNRPAFWLTIDGVEYLSHGCEFIEKTKENEQKLLSNVKHGRYYKKLLNSNIKALKYIIDASSMFEGCSIIEKINIKLPNAKDVKSMFSGCKQLMEVDLFAPRAINASRTFYDCKNLKKMKINIPKLKYGRHIIKNCINLKEKQIK